MSFKQFLFNLVVVVLQLSMLPLAVAKNDSKRNVRFSPEIEIEAKKNFKSGEHKKVIEKLAPFENEINVSSLVMLAESYSATSNVDGEISVLKTYLAREPERFHPYYLIGRALLKKGEVDDGIKMLRQSIQINKKHFPSYDLLVEAFLQTKNYYEARSELTTMKRIFGESPELLTKLCNVYSQENALAEAEETCKRAVAKDRNVVNNHIFLAQALEGRNRDEAAENVFKSAARTFPKSESVQFFTGEFYFNSGRHAIAERYLANAVEIAPKSPRSQLGLAMSLFEQKKFAEAKKHFSLACEVDTSRKALSEFRLAMGRTRQGFGGLSMSEALKLSSEYENAMAKCP